MAREYEHQINFGMGLSPESLPIQNAPGFLEAVNVVVEEGHLVPFNENVTAQTDGSIYQIDGYIFRFEQGIFSAFDPDGKLLKEIIFVGTYMKCVNYVEFLLFYNDLFYVTFDKTTASFLEGTGVDFPAAPYHIVNQNQQTFLTDRTNILYISEIGVIDFSLKENNVAGRLHFPDKIISIVRLGSSRLMVFTKIGMFELIQIEYGWGYSAYNAHILINPNAVWETGNSIHYITIDGSLHKLNSNGESKEYGYKNIFSTIATSEVDGFFVPEKNRLHIRTVDKSYVFSFEQLTCLTQTLYGYVVLNDQVVYSGHGVNETFLVTLNWINRNNTSFMLVRMLELECQQKRNNVMQGFFRVRYRHDMEHYRAETFWVPPSGEIVTMLTASDWSLTIYGPTNAFSAMYNLKYRFQYTDNSSIRGLTNAVSS